MEQGKDEKMNKKRANFTGTIGFVMAAPGSAVGLGNIWRFPYLAAKDHGGVFILCYLILAVTFGFTLLTTEIAIGRKTGRSPLTAYAAIQPKWKGLGVLACLVPIIILPYYCVIGGWVVKYFATFVTGAGSAAAGDDYFAGFIQGQYQPIIWMFIFFIMTAFVVFNGVNKGIEKYSKILMPILFVLIAGISVFSLTLKHTNADGVTRTGMQGLAIYLIPNFRGMTVKSFLSVVMDALGQLFFSISVAMGIMVAYGSYVKKDVNLMKSINQIEIFDTGIALISGLMIVPAVYLFSGGDESAMQAGSGLMFITLPKVFAGMPFGTAIGAIFFLLVLFAALTSSISLMETVVSIIRDKTSLSRRKAAFLTLGVSVLLGIPSSLGFGLWSKIKPLGMSILDFFDFISNSILMPVVAFLTCIFVVWFVGLQSIVDEIKLSSQFKREKMFRVMIQYIAPVCIVLILVSSVLNSLGVIKI